MFPGLRSCLRFASKCSVQEIGKRFYGANPTPSKAQTLNNILVTGGSRGIGLDFYRQYLENGHQVFAAS